MSKVGKGFSASKDKSKTKKEDLIAKVKSSEPVTLQDVAELLVMLLEQGSK